VNQLLTTTISSLEEVTALASCSSSDSDTALLAVAGLLMDKVTTSGDLSQILSYLYLGSKSAAKNKQLLIKHKIKYVLNCTPTRTADPENGCPNYYEKERLFVYRRIPIFDNRGEDMLSYMDLACSFINEGQHYGNVLVHCHKGISRSASFVIGYLMRKKDFTMQEALAHVQSCRNIVQPNSSFLMQLGTLQLQTMQTETNAANKSTDDNSIGPVQLAPPIGPVMSSPQYTLCTQSNESTDIQAVIRPHQSDTELFQPTAENCISDSKKRTITSICQDSVDTTILESGKLCRTLESDDSSVASQ
jgi:protein-tyrosine phosphatase